MVHSGTYEKILVPVVCSIRQHYNPPLLLTKKRLYSRHKEIDYANS